jgi:general secretion pathway protein M
MIHSLRQRWETLARRERVLLALGAAVVAVSLLFVLVVDPWMARLERLDRQITRAQREMRDLETMGVQFDSLRRRLAALEAKLASGQGRFSLLPFLEEAAAGARVRDRVAAMRPQSNPPVQGYRETVVEVRLEGVLLQEVLDLLVALENSPYLLQVKRVQMKPRFDSPHLLESTLLVSTHEKE